MWKVWYEKVKGLFRAKTKAPVRIAVLDDDRTWLLKIERLFAAVPEVELSLYHYPTNILTFRQNVENYDVLLIDQNLGTDDGLSLARGLFSAGAKPTILVVTAGCPEKFSTFKYYLDKSSVEKNPADVLQVAGTPTEQAVELSMLFHLRTGV